MGLRALSLALLLALSAHVAAAADSRSLTDSDFDAETQHGVWFVMFHVPDCNGCNVLGPIVDSLTGDDTITKEGVHVARVNCADAATVCERFGVHSLSLKVVTGGRYYNYAGTRDADQLVKFAVGGYRDAPYSDPILTYAELLEQRELAQREASEFETDSKVVVLTSEALDASLKGSAEPWLIKFYAPWCGHCKRLAPTWHRLAKTLSEAGSSFKIAKVDCEVERRACSRFGVANYPSLLLVHGDQVYKYKHGRSLKALKEFTESGWKEAELVGPIEDETFWSSVGNSLVEWGMKNKLLAGIAVVLVVVGFVSLPVLFVGGQDVDSWRQLGPRAAAKKTTTKATIKATATKTATTSSKKKKPKVE